MTFDKDGIPQGPDWWERNSLIVIIPVLGIIIFTIAYLLGV